MGLAPGDRVMQVRNNYDLEVFNGDLGLALREDDEGLVVEMDRGPVSYAPADLEDLTLAYAITVHKSQGSEYPAVVIALSSEHYIMLNRPLLLYTAVTRGKQLVIIVGQRNALKRAVEHAQPIRRYAALDRKIQQNLRLEISRATRGTCPAPKARGLGWGSECRNTFTDSLRWVSEAQAGEVRLNRQLAVSPVHQHGQVHRGRAAQGEDGLQGRAHRASGENHVYRSRPNGGLPPGS